MADGGRGGFLAHSSQDPDRVGHQTMLEHATNVADLARDNARHFGGGEMAAAAGYLHDLGKYTDAFQQRLFGGKKVDHATRGAMVARDRYGPLGWLLAYGIAGHHAGLANGSIQEDAERTPLGQRLKGEGLPPLEGAWEQEIMPLLANAQAFGPFIGKLTVDPTCPAFSQAFLVRMLFSALVDADYIDTERYYDQFELPEVRKAASRQRPMPGLDVLRTQLDRYLGSFASDSEVNLLRARILEHARAQARLAPGIFSLNVPTGGGKTLTSLAFALDHAIAHGQRRAIFVIPFTSIVEQNAAVFRRAMGPYGEEAVLEHHSAFILPSLKGADADRFQAQEKLRLAMENWDAPIIVTTAVQFFESLFASKPGQCRKLHNIANSVVILDEAQTIPLKVLRPAVAALNELSRNYRSSIVLCTATQPALEAPEFKGGFTNVRPLVADAEALARQLERVRVRHIGMLDDEEIAAQMLERDQVLCIVNNRRHARAIYESVSRAGGAVHLSTLMCARHRSRVLEGVRERLKAGEPCRVVSTSLIEAGVDVSFPRVLRAEAGLDSIAQAAGRCNRNKEWKVADSEVRVFATSNPDWQPPVELRQFAQAAQEILRHHGDDPLGPAAIRAYFEHLYWQQGDNALDGHAILPLLGGSRPESLPMESMDRRFHMIESVQKTVMIPWDEDAEQAIRALSYVDRVGGTARRLQPYTVQIPERAFRELLKSGAVQPVSPEKFGDQFMVLMNPDLYSDAYGLSWDDPNFMEAASTVI